MATKQLNADALFGLAEEARPAGHSNLANLFLQEQAKTNKLNSHRTYNRRALHLFAHLAPSDKSGLFYFCGKWKISKRK